MMGLEGHVGTISSGSREPQELLYLGSGIVRTTL